MTGREPTALTSAVGFFLSALAKAAVILGIVDWTAEQLAAISLVIDSGLIVFGMLYIRSKVTPTAAPQLTEGTEVTVTDKAGTKTGTTTV